MGYSHSWYIKTSWNHASGSPFSPDPHYMAASDFRKLLPALEERGVKLVDLNTHLPEFNGDPGCEMFSMRQEFNKRRTPQGHFGFVKTQKLPYDLAVMCALLCLKYYCLYEIQISSDGEEEDWKPAFDLCREILGFEADWYFLEYKTRDGMYERILTADNLQTSHPEWTSLPAEGAEHA